MKSHVVSYDLSNIKKKNKKKSLLTSLPNPEMFWEQTFVSVYILNVF